MRTRPQQIRSLPTTAAVAALGLLVFTVALRKGWFGPDNGAGANFCEAARDGLVRQPANTFSNLGFVVAGLLAAAHLDRHRRRMAHPHLLTAFPPLIALLGPASMAMHATQSTLGGRLDVGSMYLFAAFAAAYALTRLLRRGFLALAVLFVVLVAGAESVAGVRRPAPLVDTVGNGVFAVLLIAAVTIEVVLRRRPDHPRSPGAAAAALAAIGVAFVIWSFSHSGSAWCAPRSWLQGHAAWHLLGAVAAYCLYRYYASELRPGRPD